MTHALPQMSRVFSVMTALIATAALVLSIIAVARTPVASPTSLGPLAGIYVSGSLDQPHYFVTLHEQGDQVHGALGFVYQDGQTSVVFTFTGTGAPLGKYPERGVMVVATTPVTGTTPNVLSSKIPSSISVFYDSTSLAFGECADYLDVPSLARCVFNEDRTNKI
jgi:hypothetical protein